ncbi:MAG: ABC transporter permease subunit [Nocardioides sp.]
MTTPQNDRAFGEVYDRGYQHYTGPRLGRAHAFRALTGYSMKRALGSKKRWTAKVVPVILYTAVALLVIIPLGIQAFIDSAQILQYWDYFSVAWLILGVFVATIAPEMLCGDRREKTLILYFSRPITRLDYLLAKLLATGLLTLTITLVPLAIFWLGRQLLSDSPVSAMKNNLDDLWKIVIVCVITSAYLGALGLTISAFTSRKAIAVGIIVVAFLFASALAGVLQNVFGTNDQKAWFGLISPARTILQFATGIWDQPIQDSQFGNPLDTWIYGAAMIVITLICCAIMYWRYVPED